MVKTQDAAYDERVAELDDYAFQRAAEHIVMALRQGGGVRMWFQPGDATRYLVEVGRRQTVTVSNGEPDRRDLTRIGSVSISFGTEGDMHSTVIGHLSQLRPVHGWTAAVWRRLWDEVRTTEELL